MDATPTSNELRGLNQCPSLSEPRVAWKIDNGGSSDVSVFLIAYYLSAPGAVLRTHISGTSPGFIHTRSRTCPKLFPEASGLDHHAQRGALEMPRIPRFLRGQGSCQWGLKGHQGSIEGTVSEA